MTANNYINSFYKAPFPILERLAKEAAESNFPIIGVQTGRLLQHYATIANARRIFEMGSGFGYSALWFAAGMVERGRIICTDFSTEDLQKAE
ncbi:MAG: O-methyltransferase, partial [Calditrichaeota bacterium]